MCGGGPAELALELDARGTGGREARTADITGGADPGPNVPSIQAPSGPHFVISTRGSFTLRTSLEPSAEYST